MVCLDHLGGGGGGGGEGDVVEDGINAVCHR